MKVVAFNGSPRKNGNTAGSLKTVISELEKQGIETELIHVGKEKIRVETRDSARFFHQINSLDNLGLND